MGCGGFGGSGRRGLVEKSSGETSYLIGHSCFNEGKGAVRQVQ